MFEFLVLQDRIRVLDAKAFGEMTRSDLRAITARCVKWAKKQR